MGVFSYLLLRSSGHCCIYLRTQQKEQRLLNLCWFIYEWGVSEHFSCCLSAKFASHKSQNKVLNREERRRRRKEKKKGRNVFCFHLEFRRGMFFKKIYIFLFLFSLSTAYPPKMPSPSLCVTVYVNVAVVSIFSEKKICPSTWAEGVRKKKRTFTERECCQK